MYFQLAAELTQTFAHTTHTNSGFSCAPHLGQFLRRNPLPFVLHFDPKLIRSVCNANHGPRTAGMPMHIRKAFLHDAKNGSLHFRRQTPEIRGHLKAYLNLTAFRKTLDIQFQRGAKADFIEQRRMQQMGYGPNLPREFLYHRGTLGDRVSSLRAKTVALAFDLAKIDTQPSDQLTCAVMQSNLMDRNSVEV
jgi:hypothetical protein